MLYIKYVICYILDIVYIIYYILYKVYYILYILNIIYCIYILYIDFKVGPSKHSHESAKLCARVSRTYEAMDRIIGFLEALNEL